MINLNKVYTLKYEPYTKYFPQFIDDSQGKPMVVSIWYREDVNTHGKCVDHLDDFLKDTGEWKNE